MLYNGYSEVTRWICENPEEYEEVMKEVHMLEDEERKGIKKEKKDIFKDNFSVKNLELFTNNSESEEIEIPF